MSKKQIQLEFVDKVETIKQGIMFGLTSDSKNNLEWLDELEKYASMNPLLYGQDRIDYMNCIEQMRKEELAKL